MLFYRQSNVYRFFLSIILVINQLNAQILFDNKFIIYYMKIKLLLLLLLLFNAITLLPGGSGYFTCIQNMKLVTNKFKSGGLHEKHVVATCNFGNHLSICL